MTQEHMTNKVVQATGEPIGPEVAAVIAAAVAAALGKDARIKRIRYRSRPVEQAWVNYGRTLIMGSHTPRH